MAAIEWIRFLCGAFLLLFGLCIFVIEMFGVFRFKYVLNRMHAAAMGDTLGIGFSLAGLIVMNGLNFTSLKLLFVIIFLWFSSPTSSHLIARLEVTTDEEPEKHYRRMTIAEAAQENAQAEMEVAQPKNAQAEMEEVQPKDAQAEVKAAQPKNAQAEMEAVQLKNAQAEMEAVQPKDAQAEAKAARKEE